MEVDHKPILENSEIIRAIMVKARKLAGVSQRVLSDRTGIQQSQISKIENGSVDPRLSTMTELARALGLEIMVVPQKSIPLFKSMSELLATPESTTESDMEARPAYSLDEVDDG